MFQTSLTTQNKKNRKPSKGLSFKKLLSNWKVSQSLKNILVCRFKFKAFVQTYDDVIKLEYSERCLHDFMYQLIANNKSFFI